MMVRTRGCQNLDSFDYNKTAGLLETFRCPNFCSSQGSSLGTKMSSNLFKYPISAAYNLQDRSCHPNRLTTGLVALMSMDIILVPSHHGSQNNLTMVSVFDFFLETGGDGS